jgi:hypothetical protein
MFIPVGSTYYVREYYENQSDCHLHPERRGGQDPTAGFEAEYPTRDAS